MPDPLTDRLGRFTPEAGSIDRDAILFAAGRASVRPQRNWKALAGLLALTQALTLLLLLPWPADNLKRPSPHPDDAGPPGSAPGLWHRRLVEVPSAPPPASGSYAPDAPPLRPMSVLHSSPLN